MNIMELTEIDWGGRHTGEGGTPYSIYYTSLFIYSFYMPRVLMIKEQISFIAHKENEQLDFASFVLLSAGHFHDLTRNRYQIIRHVDHTKSINTKT